MATDRAEMATELIEQIGDRTVSRLLEVCGDPARFTEFIVALERSGGAGRGSSQ